MIPMAIVESCAVCILIYFMSGLTVEADRFFFFLLCGFLSTIFMANVLRTNAYFFSSLAVSIRFLNFIYLECSIISNVGYFFDDYLHWVYDYTKVSKFFIFTLKSVIWDGYNLSIGQIYTPGCFVL